MGSFNGSDTTSVTLELADVTLVARLLGQTSFAGVHLPVANSLDVLFTDAQPGALELSHDQIALLLYVIDHAAFDQPTRPVAASLRTTLKAAHDGFYQRARNDA